MRLLPTLTAVLAIFLAACRMGNPEMSARNIVAANDPALRFSGRWYHSDPLRPRASWPGFSVATGFTGSSIGVRMIDSGNYYNVYIDGRLTGIVHGQGRREQVHPLAAGLKDGVHQLRLTRRNLSFGKPTVFSGLVLEPEARLISEIDAPRLKIEFIGDSFTAAEGNESTEPTLSWQAKAAVTNADRGFAAFIADHYGAEHVTVCRSGSGLISDFTGSRSAPMSERYHWTLMENREPSWDHQSWVPDLVVVALGLNDFSGLKGSDGRVSETHTNEFIAAYQKFLTEIRGQHPDAIIVALAAHPPWLRKTIREAVDTSGDRKIRYAQFDQFPGGYVADGHPSVATHRQIADQVIRQIDPFMSPHAPVDR